VKTEASKRVCEVPDRLRPALLALAKTRQSGPLFPGRTRYWLHYHVARLCRAAGVPEVCPHGLRGTHSTLVREAGLTSNVIAQALGQTSPQVTERHDIAPGTSHRANARRALVVLKGGRA
jgi:integrase